MADPFLHSGEFDSWGINLDDLDEPDGDPHADCIQPHRGPDGYTDCDGRPL